MDIKISEYQLPAEIDFNFEEIKAGVLEKTEPYKRMVYAESDIKAAKEDRAELNRQKKALNDERISCQKAYMVPFDAFKKKVDEIIAIIDESVKNIDVQVKAFEDKAKEEKEHLLRQKFAEWNTYDWLQFDQVFNPKWLNASTTISSVEVDVNIILSTIAANLNSLKGLPYEFETIEKYKETLSMSDALAESKRLVEMATKKAEVETVPVSDEPRSWMTVKVLINSNEYDTLVAWLDKQGIEKEII